MREIRSLGLGTVPYRTLDIRQDDVDARDYPFTPSLALLPELVDPRWDRARVILDQETEGACVGFALAAVINASLFRRTDLKPSSRKRAAARPGAPPDAAMLASPRMLYEMGRRYDDWPGECYEGTTLRGAMKGWHHHGVCSEKWWPYRIGRKPGHLDPERAEDARRRPLGA